MGVSCEILINTCGGGYKPGDPVCGVVKYAVDDPLEVRNVILSFVGSGRCNWTEPNSDNDGSTRRMRMKNRGDEEYFRKTINVVDKARIITIPVGSYEFPFKFSLPRNIPPSFRTKSACISYVLLLKFKRPGIFTPSKKFASEVTVLSCLNDEPTRPLTFELEKTLNKPFSTRKQNINLRAQINKNIVSPGEKVLLTLTVRNDTDVTINAIETALVRLKAYTVDSERTETEQLTVKDTIVQSPSIPKNSEVNLTQEVPISPDIYSVLNSSIIKVEYKVKVTLRLPIPHVNSSLEIPVLIGEKHLENPPTYWDVVGVTEKSKDLI